jgi:phenylpropionate dioxygenase-like ring-hydroxylating dioxygenase large terminal subunit
MNSTPGFPKDLAVDRFVDNRVYSDPDVYRLELQRVLGRSWIFVCHESEIANVGDFVTTTNLGSPILVTRDHDERTRAYLNVCRHRGCKVVSGESGHASAFRCPYHFWVYSLEGELVGISGEETYEGSGFRKEEHPLVELACQSIYGMVFVHFGEDPPSLLEWLGPELVAHLAQPLAENELVVVKHQSWELPINWKIFAENVRDGYHVPFVHPFFRKASPPGQYNVYRGGHAFQRLGMDSNGVDPELWAQIRQHPLPGVEEGEGYIANIFPDFNVTLRSNVVSIDSQRTVGPDKVILENRTLGLAGDSEDVTAIRQLSHLTWFQNPVELEDMPIFLAQQEGVVSPHVRYSVIARGDDATSGFRGDDNRLRHFWAQWRSMMDTRANSVDPSLSDS